MSKIRKQLLFIGLAALVFGCVPPLNKKYYDETAETNMNAIRSELDSADFALLESAIIRLKAQNKRLIDVTYAEILLEGKKWALEQAEMEAENVIQEEVAKEEALKTEKLNQVVQVLCIEKGFVESHHFDQLTFKFLIRNNSEKEISTIKGEVSFNNKFDEFNSTYFFYDQPIGAGQEVIWDTSTDYVPFMGIHEDLKNKNLKDLKYVWKPDQIIFEDGTILE